MEAPNAPSVGGALAAEEQAQKYEHDEDATEDAQYNGDRFLVPSKGAGGRCCGCGLWDCGLTGRS